MKITLHSLLIAAYFYWQIPTFTAEDGGFDLYLVIAVKTAEKHKIANKKENYPYNFAFRAFLAPGNVTAQKITDFLKEEVDTEVIGIGAFDETVQGKMAVKDIKAPKEDEVTDTDNEELPFEYLQNDKLNKPLSEVVRKGVVRCSSKKALQVLWGILQEEKPVYPLKEALRKSEEAGHSVLWPYKKSFKFTSITKLLPLLKNAQPKDDSDNSTLITAAVAGTIAVSLGAGMLAPNKGKAQKKPSASLTKEKNSLTTQ